MIERKEGFSKGDWKGEKLIRKLENEYEVLTAKVRKWLKDEGVTLC